MRTNMEELLIFNEWWQTQGISKQKALPYERKIMEKIMERFRHRQILILTGLRRVGKTTLMYQLIKKLLDRGINAKNIIYFNFDKRIEEPIEIFKECEKITKVDWKKEKIFVFFDEIQKLKNWHEKIKLLYDSLPNIKFCLSGSAGLMLEKGAIDNLAGRHFKLEVSPLSLKEFAELYYGKTIENFELFQDKIEAVFDDYLERPFPEIVKWENKEEVNEYITSMIIEKVVSDIPMIFKKVNISLLRALLELFYKNNGMILNIDELSKNFHVHKLTLKEHLFFLEFGKLIRIVKNYRPSIMAESRKMQKIYAYHPSLAKVYFFEDKGKLYENLIMHILNLDKYFREKDKEIDFIKKNKEILPIEVTSREEIEKKKLKNLGWFMKKYNVKKGWIIYQGKEKIVEEKNKKIILKNIVKISFE